MMRLPTAVILAIMLLFLGLFAWDRTHRAPAQTNAQDSVAVAKLRQALHRSDSARDAYEDLYANAVAHASQDSLSAWLHARAFRPLPRGLDTILRSDTSKAAEEFGSSQRLDSFVISREEAQRLLIHGSVQTDSINHCFDSLAFIRAKCALDTSRLYRDLHRPWWQDRHLTVSAAARLGLGTIYPGASADYSVGPVVAGAELTTGSASVRLGWRF